MESKKLTEISDLGEFALIDRLTGGFNTNHPTTLCGVGDDAAVVEIGNEEVMLLSTDMLLEGVDFDLEYFPLKHLGYKAVTVAVSDILAMNALPTQITVGIGVSAKMSVEALDALYEGIRAACEAHKIDLVGGDSRASMSGLVISTSVVGRAKKSEVVRRSGAKPTELICLTGNLGAAYMGLHLLEREKIALRGVEHPEPEFKGYEYLLQRYLKPQPRIDVVESLAEAKIVPSSMIDISDGLASEVMQICKSSKCGARIYLERIPIARQTSELAEQMHIDPVMAALNGGEDYEMLFTLPLAMHDRIKEIGGIDVIGHITQPGTGAYMVLPDGSEIELKAQGFR